MPTPPEQDPITNFYSGLISEALNSHIGEPITEEIVESIVDLIASSEFRLVSSAFVSRRIGVSRQRVAQLHQEGKLPTHAIIEGGYREYRESPVWVKSDIEEFANQRGSVSKPLYRPTLF